MTGAPSLRLCLVLLAGLLCAALPAATARAESGAPAPDLCRAATTREEARHTMPDNLLSAISLVESGRWDKARQARVAWPWTVMAEGRGRYLPSKQAAIAEVKGLQARGVRNIDVGCMQVNLHWHGDAFGSLEEALDPAANAAYAAQFLQELYAETRDWDVAAAWYHSRTPERAEYYSGKVQVALSELAGAPRPPTAVGQAETDSVRQRVAAIRKQIEDRRQELAEERERARRITEARRATAKAFAEDWRRRKMDDYLQKEAEEAVDAIINRL